MGVNMGVYIATDGTENQYIQFMESHSIIHLEAYAVSNNYVPNVTDLLAGELARATDINLRCYVVSGFDKLPPLYRLVAVFPFRFRLASLLRRPMLRRRITWTQPLCRLLRPRRCQQRRPPH